MQVGAAKAAGPRKCTFDQTRDGGRRSNRHILQRNNSAAHCSISHKFGTDFVYVTAETQQTFKIKGSKVTVTVTYRISSKSVISQERVSLLSLNLVEIIPGRSAT